MMTNLERVVERLGITVKFTHLGLRVHDQDQGGYNYDLWSAEVMYGEKKFKTEYRTGLGCRKLSGFTTLHNDVYSASMGGKPGTRDLAQAAEFGYTKVVPPKAADLIYSLCADAMGCDQSFSNWASDLGYSDDSIKAQQIYFACQKTRDEMMKMFGNKTFNKLCEACQDY